jgi:putative transcriptional regulator
MQGNMPKKVRVKIKELLEKEGISLRELGDRADIRHAALSKLSNQKRKYIYVEHIEKMVNEFNIEDIREIIDLEDEPNED